MKKILSLTFSLVLTALLATAQLVPPVKFVAFANADQLAATYDKADTVSKLVRNQVFLFYKTGKWKQLSSIFTLKKLNNAWPPANGGYNILNNVAIKAGQKFDRYSNAIGNYTGEGFPSLGGNFTSPIIKGHYYTFAQRALNLPENAYDFYFEIEVLKDLPFQGQTADVIPWFSQVGGGKQIMWGIPQDPSTGYPMTWNKLASLGYIKITIKKSPSGKYPQLVNQHI